MTQFSLANLFGMTIRESANDGSDFTNPDADFRRLFLGEDGLLHVKDSSGTVTAPYTGGGGTTFTVGGPLILPAPYSDPGAGTNAGFNANEAFAWPVSVPGDMLLQGLVGRYQATGAGTHEWGLFDYSSSQTAATKVAGGSSAVGSTGFVTIAATGAPVSVPAGNYVCILKAPAASAASYYYYGVNTAPGVMLTQGSYTWDDTPDLTTGWSNSGGVLTQYLLGRLASGEQWP